MSLISDRKELGSIFSQQLSQQLRRGRCYLSNPQKIKNTAKSVAGAAICSSVDSSAPSILYTGFESQANHLKSIVIYLSLYREKDENKQKRSGLAHN